MNFNLPPGVLLSDIAPDDEKRERDEAEKAEMYADCEREEISASPPFCSIMSAACCGWPSDSGLQRVFRLRKLAEKLVKWPACGPEGFWAIEKYGHHDSNHSRRRDAG